MAMTREDGTLTTEVGKDVGKEGTAKKKNAILELLGFAGNRRVLAYVGCGLSALNAVLTVMPLVCVWFVVRDLVSVYPNWAEASSAAMWWMMGREDEKGGRHFMELYQAALMRMSAAATEYVRGIPVVKVFQQTVLSFRAFHEAIATWRRIIPSIADDPKSCSWLRSTQPLRCSYLRVLCLPASRLISRRF